MSQDLWSEFASVDSPENPWGRQEARAQSDFDEDDFGDFQGPKPENITEKPHTFTPTTNEPLVSISQTLGPSKTFARISTDDSPLGPSNASPNQERHSSLDGTTLVMSRNNALQTSRSEISSPVTPEAFNRRVKDSPTMQPPALDTFEEDEWGDFMEVPISSNVVSSGMSSEDSVDTKAQYLTSSNARTSPIPKTTTAPDESLAATSQEAPPSNVPPPSILLLLIADIFESLLTDITNALASTAVSPGSHSLLDHQSIDSIKNRLSLVRAAGRIIAGRKLRWRRDSRLSQSMKIGPAHAGRSGGMKLTGIDRTETRREDGEVEEAVRKWKQHVGSLRVVVGTVTSREPGLSLVVPDISEPMPIRTAKANEGAITAPSCCFLCGLKRDERVEKVEVKVEDSFGEWWVNHWGHVDCRIFWDEQKQFLPQR